MHPFFAPVYLLIAQGTFTSFFLYATFYRSQSTTPAYQPSLRYQLECRQFGRGAHEYFLQFQFIPPAVGNFCLSSNDPRIQPKPIERYTFELCYQPNVQQVEEEYCLEHAERFMEEEFGLDPEDRELDSGRVFKQIPRRYLNASFLVRSVAICGSDEHEQRVASGFHHVTTSREDWTKHCL